MSQLTHSEHLANILAHRIDAAYVEADGSCTTGYDNGGSTGFEIFENGFRLANRAGGRPVTYAVVRTGVEGVVFFFIGTEEEACARAQELEEDESED